MRTFYFVKPEEGDMARRMEAKLLKLPPASGVLFAGVSVVPMTETDSALYRVWVGCHRDLDESVMDPLVRVTLREELEAGARIVVEAHRGVVR